MLRHYFADIYFDDVKTWRTRIGQSEVPTSFEALQSSSRRRRWDRSDAMENFRARRTGTRRIRVLDAGSGQAAPTTVTSPPVVKGTGDYGAVGLGVFNGQGGNPRGGEQFATRHRTYRVPFPVFGQYVESVRTLSRGPTRSRMGSERWSRRPSDFDDRRVGGTFVLYPQPFGIQAE